MKDATQSVSAGSHRATIFQLGLAVIAISFASFFFKKAAAPPLVAAAIRLAFATVLLLIPAIRARRAGRLSPRVQRAAALAGVFYGVHFGAWVTSLGLTSVAASVTLVTATPVMLGVIALVTGRDRPTRRHWLSIGLALVGVIIIGGSDYGSTAGALEGDALAIMGAAAMAGYFLSARRVMAGGDQAPCPAGDHGRGVSVDMAADPWGFSCIACGVGAACLGTGALVTHASFAVEPATLGWLALAALVPQIIGHGLMTRALRHARPTVVGMVTVGEPVGATLLAWLFLHETIGPVGAVGCVITATATAVALAARE